MKTTACFKILFLGAALLFGTSACVLDDDNDDAAPLFSNGLNTLVSGGVEREYFLIVPDAGSAGPVSAAATEPALPIVFAYHGFTGSLDNWVGDNAIYDLVPVIGDEAVIVVPNGRVSQNGDREWGGQADLDFFIDLLNELERLEVPFDPNRVFIAGHSLGAGFGHELVCTYGDIIRAGLLAAGALLKTDCVGSAAMMMWQGSNDEITTPGIARATRDYWVLYNGWDTDAFTEEGICDDYSFPGEANSAYPMVWCEHTDGHDWTDGNSDIGWAWLKNLPPAEPTLDFPAGGGPERATPAQDTFLVVQLDVPSASPQPLRLAATLRTPDYISNPTCSIPDVFLNPNFAVDDLTPGQVSEQIAIPITFFIFGSGELQFPSDWTLALSVYVEGGGTGSVPTPGVDYQALLPLTVLDRNTPITIDTPLALEIAPDVCGF